MIARQVHSPVLDPHQQAFLADREYVVLGSIDTDGRPWASILFGDRGFAAAPDRSTIAINALPVEGDRLSGIGNFAFNTLGNFTLNPVAGLLFIDFETGAVLQLTGRTEILWEGDPELDGIQGAQRGWKFHLAEGNLITNAISGTWQFGDYSPATLRTGTWDRA